MTINAGEVVRLLPPGVDLPPAKRRLYEVALELFGREGFHAVSIRDIGAALGLNSSTIYFHVSSKQDLLFELAVMGHRSHLESLRAALLDAGDEPRDQLRAVVAAHVRGHLEFPSMARLTNRELRALGAEQYESVVAIRTESEQITIDIIERGVRVGVFTSVDPVLDAKAIGAMGVRLPEWWTDDGTRTREQIIEHYVNIALKIVS